MQNPGQISGIPCDSASNILDHRMKFGLSPIIARWDKLGAIRCIGDKLRASATDFRILKVRLVMVDVASFPMLRRVRMSHVRPSAQ